MSDPILDQIYAQAAPKTNPLTQGSAPQVSGQVPTQANVLNLGKSLLPTPQQTPQLVGSMFPQFLGTAAGPEARLLAGVGAATGDALEQAREGAKALLGKPDPEYQAPTPLGSLKRTGQAFLNGVVGQAGGEAMGKLLSPFSSSVTPEIQQQVKTAQEVGITPPISNMTNSKAVQAGERYGEYSLFGSKITQMKQDALAGLKNYVENLAQKIGVNRSPTMAGNFAKEAQQGFLDNYDQAVDNVYDSVWPKVKDLPVNAQLVINKLDEIISRRSGPAETPGLNNFRDWRTQIATPQPTQVPTSAQAPGMVMQPPTPTVKTVADLRNLKTNIGFRGKFNDPAISGIKSDLEELYGTTLGTLEHTINQSDPQAGQQLQAANELYKNGKDLMKTDLFNQISKVDPAQVHSVVMQSPTTYNTAKEILGDGPMKDITRQWFDNLVQRSVVQNGGTPTPSPLKLANLLYQNQKNGILPSIMNDRPDLEKPLTDLMDISKLMTRGGDISHGSQTAFASNLWSNVAKVSQLIGTAVMAPQHALATGAGLGAESAGINMLTTDAGRKFLTTGYPKLGTAVTAIGKPIIQSEMEKSNDRSK